MGLTDDLHIVFSSPQLCRGTVHSWRLERVYPCFIHRSGLVKAPGSFCNILVNIDVINFKLLGADMRLRIKSKMKKAEVVAQEL